MAEPVDVRLWPFCGLVSCANCHAPLAAAGVDAVQRYYTCRCTGHLFDADDLDDLVATAVVERLIVRMAHVAFLELWVCAAWQQADGIARRALLATEADEITVSVDDDGTLQPLACIWNFDAPGRDGAQITVTPMLDLGWEGGDRP